MGCICRGKAQLSRLENVDERRDLLFRLGRVCLDELDREDGFEF